MAVTTLYSEIYRDSDVCRIAATGETTLADLHVALLRHTHSPLACASILLDLRRCLLKATRPEVERFNRYLIDELFPHLERCGGVLAWLPGIDPDFVNPGETGLSRVVDELARTQERFRLASDSDEVEALLQAS